MARTKTTARKAAPPTDSSTNGSVATPMQVDVPQPTEPNASDNNNSEPETTTKTTKPKTKNSKKRSQPESSPDHHHSDDNSTDSTSITVATVVAENITKPAKKRYNLHITNSSSTTKPAIVAHAIVPSPHPMVTARVALGSTSVIEAHGLTEQANTLKAIKDLFNEISQSSSGFPNLDDWNSYGVDLLKKSEITSFTDETISLYQDRMLIAAIDGILPIKSKLEKIAEHEADLLKLGEISKASNSDISEIASTLAKLSGTEQPQGDILEIKEWIEGMKRVSNALDEARGKTMGTDHTTASAAADSNLQNATPFEVVETIESVRNNRLFKNIGSVYKSLHKEDFMKCGEIEDLRMTCQDGIIKVQATTPNTPDRICGLVPDEFERKNFESTSMMSQYIKNQCALDQSVEEYTKSIAKTQQAVKALNECLYQEKLIHKVLEGEIHNLLRYAMNIPFPRVSEMVEQLSTIGIYDSVITNNLEAEVVLDKETLNALVDGYVKIKRTFMVAKLIAIQCSKLGPKEKESASFDLLLGSQRFSDMRKSSDNEDVKLASALVGGTRRFIGLFLKTLKSKSAEWTYSSSRPEAKACSNDEEYEKYIQLLNVRFNEATMNLLRSEHSSRYHRTPNAVPVEFFVNLYGPMLRKFEEWSAVNLNNIIYLCGEDVKLDFFSGINNINDAPDILSFAIGEAIAVLQFVITGTSKVKASIVRAQIAVHKAGVRLSYKNHPNHGHDAEYVDLHNWIHGSRMVPLSHSISILKTMIEISSSLDGEWSYALRIPPLERIADIEATDRAQILQEIEVSQNVNVKIWLKPSNGVLCGNVMVEPVDLISSVTPKPKGPVQEGTIQWIRNLAKLLLNPKVNIYQTIPRGGEIDAFVKLLMDDSQVKDTKLMQRLVQHLDNSLIHIESHASKTLQDYFRATYYDQKPISEKQVREFFDDAICLENVYVVLCGLAPEDESYQKHKGAVGKSFYNGITITEIDRIIEDADNSNNIEDISSESQLSQGGGSVLDRLKSGFVSSFAKKGGNKIKLVIEEDEISEECSYFISVLQKWEPNLNNNKLALRVYRTYINNIKTTAE